MSSYRSNATSSRSRFSQVILYCSCGRRATRHVATTDLNRGRPFYTCSINKDEIGYCGYFNWVDNLTEELEADEALGTVSMKQGKQCIREVGREDGRDEGKEAMWKAQVKPNLYCMGTEMKIFRTIVYGIFLIQLLSMVVFVCIHTK